MGVRDNTGRVQEKADKPNRGLGPLCSAESRTVIDPVGVRVAQVAPLDCGQVTFQEKLDINRRFSVLLKARTTAVYG